MSKLYLKLFLPVILICTSLCLFAQKKPAEKKNANIQTNARTVLRMFDKFHCTPRALDDELYGDIARCYIRSLDPGRIYLTDEDVKQLNNLTVLKEQLGGNNDNYLNKAIEIYKQRLLQARTTIGELEQKPFDFGVNETFFMPRDSNDFAANEAELKQRMYKLMKYQTLSRLMENSMADSTLKKDDVLKQEPIERAVVVKIRNRSITHRIEHSWGFELFMKTLLYDAISDAYDPHSEFLPEVKRDNFYGFSSGNAYSYGLRLKENDKGEVVIAGLVPGSLAWKSGELNKDDVLICMQWGNKPVVDLEGADLDEVEHRFEEQKGYKLKLIVRKMDGSLKPSLLIRGWFGSEKEIVKGFILNGQKKIGYIRLPAFYGEWESVHGSGCANDVLKEIQKLARQDIDGLVIDLRYNGGGSMQEANQLAGLFLDEGPVGFIRQKGGFVKQMDDPFIGVLYGDPLLIMVNAESASASEYVAGALQDYNRALIVGTPTFGKASAQRFVPADTTITKPDFLTADYDTKARDQVKITVGKLYRITGKSNQLSGVQPDVVLPGVFDSVEFRERSMKHYLVADTLTKRAVFDPLRAIPVQQLAAKSAARIEVSHGFQLVKQARALFAEMHHVKEKPLPLQYDKYMELSRKYAAVPRSMLKQIEHDSTTDFKVEIPPELMTTAKQEKEQEKDLATLEANNRFRSNILNDLYIREVFAIMNDYIDLKKK